MTALSEYETAQANLQSLIDWHASQSGETRNEATTRLQLIDRLITQCLDWPPEQVVCEERMDGSYADYVLGKPRQLVVEAKREGIYFELPAGFRQRVCALKTLYSGNPAIEAAVRQALDYAVERGVPFAATCNGTQLTAFIAARQDGVAPLDGRVVVFESLSAMLEDFRCLWDSLSLSGIRQRNMERLLRVGAPPAPPPKLSESLFNYPGFKNRNDLQTELGILGDLVIEDIAKDPTLADDFLRECYCPSGALSQYALISRSVLKARYDLLGETSEVTARSVRNRDGVSGQLTADAVAASLSRRPIILLGDVGVGKTMFIQHLIHVDAKDVFDRAVALYMDFGSQPALARELTTYVVDEIQNQLRESHGVDVQEAAFVRGVYHSELERFRTGLYGELAATNPDEFARHEREFLERKLANTETHLRACLQHIVAGRRQQVVIFLDNIDQRPDDFQDEVFLMAEGFARSWPATVFVSLRPDTFYRSRGSGSLTGYQTRVFTISPPRPERVISRRLRFAQQQLQSQQILRVFPSGLSLKSDTLMDYLGVLIGSFSGSRRLKELIDNLSAGNIRRALDLLRSFVGSGHVDTAKILSILHDSGSYIVPLHEFLRAVIYGDNEYYDPSRSQVANILDVTTRDGREHFLQPILLVYIERMGDSAHPAGFVRLDQVIDWGTQLGFQRVQVDGALARAVAKQLIEVDSFAGSEPERCRITSAGAYTLKRLLGMFVYVDAISVDTPIVDESCRLVDARDIKSRLDRARLFRSYLDAQWGLLTGLDTGFNWPQVSAALATDIERVEKRSGPRGAVVG